MSLVAPIHRADQLVDVDGNVHDYRDGQYLLDSDKTLIICGCVGYDPNLTDLNGAIPDELAIIAYAEGHRILLRADSILYIATPKPGVEGYDVKLLSEDCKMISSYVRYTDNPRVPQCASVLTLIGEAYYVIIKDELIPVEQSTDESIEDFSYPTIDDIHLVRLDTIITKSGSIFRLTHTDKWTLTHIDTPFKAIDAVSMYRQNTLLYHLAIDQDYQLWGGNNVGWKKMESRLLYNLGIRQFTTIISIGDHITSANQSVHIIANDDYIYRLSIESRIDIIPGDCIVLSDVSIPFRLWGTRRLDIKSARSIDY